MSDDRPGPQPRGFTARRRDRAFAIRRSAPVRRSLAALSAMLLCAGAAQAQDNAGRMSERAFEGAQWAMATRAARAVAQMGARAAAGDGPLARMIRTRQELQDRLDGVRAKFAEAQTGDGGAARLRDAILAFERESAALDADIRARFPDYADVANPKPLGYDALRALLAPDEALVLILSAPQATYVWAVSPTDAAWHRASLSAAELEDRVRHLRADLDPTTGPSRAAVAMTAPSRPAVPGYDLDAAHRLFADLLAPVMPALAETAHVFVVKDGALSSLPLAVLLDAPPVARAGLAGQPWLLRRFALTTLPGVSSLASIRANIRDSIRAPRGPEVAANPADGLFIGFGDPAFGGAQGPATGSGAQVASRAIDAFFDDSGSRVEAIRRLPALPGTARELRQIARLFPPGHAQVLTGTAATETAVKTADLSRAAILSFATHGLITGDISGLAEPALALTPPEIGSPEDDGLLTASEASQLTLSADWVILSACNTAAGDGTPGAEGLSGLARAFLFAGARSILVSHWPVRDDVAARLTADTLRRLNRDPALGRSRALQAAILSLMADPSDPTLAHPAAWAPFVVVGEGGSLRR